MAWTTFSGTLTGAWTELAITTLSEQIDQFWVALKTVEVNATYELVGQIGLWEYYASADDPLSNSKQRMMAIWVKNLYGDGVSYQPAKLLSAGTPEGSGQIIQAKSYIGNLAYAGAWNSS